MSKIIFSVLSILSCLALVACGSASSWAHENEAYLKKYAAEEGVVSMPSGLLYKVLKEGEAGGKTPLKTTPCACRYAGTDIHGVEFDSSGNAPVTFAPNQVIAGWTEALMLMKEGDKWQLVIPQQLAYGTRDHGPIKGNSTLIFSLELEKVVGPAQVHEL